MIKNTSQNRSQNHQKSIKNRSKIDQKLVHFGRSCLLLEGLGDPKAAVEVQELPGRGLVGTGSDQGRLGRRFWSQFGPNMGPSWEPKSSKKVLEDDAKRCQFLDGLRDPTWSGFGWILRPKMEPCWLQNRFPNGR